VKPDPFYIGWQDRAPEPLVGPLRLTIAAACLLTLVAALALASGQRPFRHGSFEFGVERTFAGVLRAEPVPTFEPEGGGGVRWLVVGEGKRSWPDAAREAAGRRVRVTGSLIDDGDRTMLELHPGKGFDDLGPAAPALPPRREGTIRLSGELVDTKCFLGVMRPADGKVHRACAANCLAGGVPPGLWVRNEDGSSRVYLLTGEDGGPTGIGPDRAATRLEIRGQLEIHGDLAVVRVASWRPAAE